MRFYTTQHRYYCGIDLHARRVYICVLDAEGQIRVHRNGPATPEHFLTTVAAYREDLVVAVECIFTWYWLADLCAQEGIAFVLGHALYLKAMHSGKAKNDKIHAHKIAVLVRGGMRPMAYVYPPVMRATRDLLRRRFGERPKNVREQARSSRSVDPNARMKDRPPSSLEVTGDLVAPACRVRAHAFAQISQIVHGLLDEHPGCRRGPIAGNRHDVYFHIGVALERAISASAARCFTAVAVEARVAVSRLR
jgi:hypothetical protein